MTWGEARLWAAQQLALAGIESFAIEARVIVAHAIGISTSKLLAEPHQELSSLHQQLINHLVSGRLRQVPLAYLTGWREFYGRDFIVDPRVLIPRHETELLVERALTQPGQTLGVCDLCTGSGAIGITLKLERPQWQVTALDLSNDALEVARRNASHHEATINIAPHDGTQPWHSEPFNLLVSNPPYVETAADLPAEVRHHEPGMALFAGADGLDFYRAFALVAHTYITPGGTILLEHGKGQSEAITSLFEGWNAASWPDLAGITRVLELTRSPH